MDTGTEGTVIEMRAFGAALMAAAAIQREPHNGMMVSVSGTLSLAARALREMAVAPETSDSVAQEEHAERCSTAQPEMRAYALEEFARHIAMVKAAVEQGNVSIVRQFFEVYKFD